MLLSNCYKQLRASQVFWIALVFLIGLFPGIKSTALAATDISELMEKAIYTEESVGDLDEAIKVYEQVVAEGQAADELSAQAQFRIGECYAKQGKESEANAAFQLVIDNYPKVKAVVQKAKKRLPRGIKLLPVPWGDGDEMIYELKLATGMGVGHQVFRVNQAELKGDKVWEFNAWQTVTLNNQAGKSRVYANFETFAPITSRWKHTMLGDSQAVYSDDEVKIELLNKDEPVTIALDGPAYDNEQVAEMFRRLPLEEGYKEAINVIPILTATSLPLEVEVTGMQTLEVPAGKFECFVLQLNIGQTFWISNDEHRYIVRFEAGGVTADLKEAYPYEAGQAKVVGTERFTLEIPADWYAYQPTGQSDRGYTHTRLIDPSASIKSYINARPAGKIKEKFDSPEAWAEDSIKKHQREKAGFKLSEKGIESFTIGDRKACQVVFESKEGDKPRTDRMIVCLSDDSAVNLRFTISSDEFDTHQAAIDELLSHLIVK